MKQAENNEIDILLHGLASRQRSAPTELAGNVTGAHLDADELNSYAEGALPLSTRARYTSHLAECDDCRKIVTQLSLAAGPLINETPISRSSATFDWRKMVAALFAPAVLRYAMPALALVVVGVAFFAWQQQRRELVAVNNRQSQVGTATQPGSALTKEQSGPVDQIAEPGKAATPSATHAASSADKAGEKTPDTAKPASSAASTEKQPAKNEVAALSQPTYAPEPAPPPAAAKPATGSETRGNAQVASRIADEKPAPARKREADKESENARADASASRAAADAPVAGKDDDRKKAKAIDGAARGAVQSRDEKSETRTVGGRHFQRHNNIWVDAAYSYSVSPTPVTRGSEQYRALVADEPGIDSIAKQLSGEVIVVWKGRAYHIR
jgi:hypothetical protein